MNNIIYFLLLLLMPITVISAEVYSINQENSNIKVYSEKIPQYVKSEGKEFEIVINESLIQAVVLRVISEDRLLLNVSDASQIEIGYKFDFPKMEEFDNVESEPEIEYGNYFSSYDNYSYELSPEGFRSYMDEELIYSNRTLYNKLNIKLHLIQARDGFGKAIKGISLVTGGLLVILASPTFENEEASEEDKKIAREIGGRGLLLMLVGGVIGQALISPKSEISDLINQHNEKNTGEPIRFSKNSIIEKSSFNLLAFRDSFSLNYEYRF